MTLSQTSPYMVGDLLIVTRSVILWGSDDANDIESSTRLPVGTLLVALEGERQRRRLTYIKVLVDDSVGWVSHSNVTAI